MGTVYIRVPGEEEVEHLHLKGTRKGQQVPSRRTFVPQGQTFGNIYKPFEISREGFGLSKEDRWTVNGFWSHISDFAKIFKIKGR